MNDPPLDQGCLIAMALALGARSVEGWSPAEELLAAGAPPARPEEVAAARRAMALGFDPLGEAFCRLKSPEQRRPMGATYTPAPIVAAMAAWARKRADEPARIVDPGCGSGRFLLAAGRLFPRATLVGVEVDPFAAVLARGHLAACGLGERAEVRVRDYREVGLSGVEGRTLFIGNPPYVRHHLVGEPWKAWLTATATRRGLTASQLAGLHVHFFLATAEQAAPGDYGVLITAAEWLDVNYGRLVRELLCGPLGVESLQVIEPAALPFPDAAATAVICCFEVGTRRRSVRLRRIGKLAHLGSLESGRPTRRERLEGANRWTPLTRPTRKGRVGFIELGELCRVHRGQVTGANHIWIADRAEADLPAEVLVRTVTKARELFAAGGVLSDASALRSVIDLPVDLDRLTREERQQVERFLKRAKAMGARDGFVASHRKAWWSVGLREPAPILATYMARRPPAFVLNLAQARHINIAHGLYPRERLSEGALAGLVSYLAREVSTSEGRTYAGGLTKFEPKEMERLLVPGVSLLRDLAASATA